MKPAELQVSSARPTYDDAIAELRAAWTALGSSLVEAAAALHELAKRSGAIAAAAEHMAHEARVQHEHPHAMPATFRVLK